MKFENSHFEGRDDFIDPEVLSFKIIKSPVGLLVAAATSNGLCILDFYGSRMNEAKLEKFGMDFNAIALQETNEHIDQAEHELNEYFEKRRSAFSVKLIINGTPFQQKVWSAISKIPYGKTDSYTNIAKILSIPQSIRAVANAIGKNPIMMIIPCHRIIGKSGLLTGYAGGVKYKRLLLELEDDMFLF